MASTTISAAVRTAIKKSGRRQADIAREANIPASGLSRLVSGQRSLRVDRLEKLFDTLGLEVREREMREATET